MKNAALSGKPYAGNPHVRFDEGEVASAKPRRGSLLYRKVELVIGILFHGFVLMGMAKESVTNDVKTIRLGVDAKDIFSAVEQSRRLGAAKRIVVPAGEWLLTSPVVLDERDAGLEIVGEGDARLLGGCRLEGWTKEGDLYSIPLPDGAKPRMLLIGNDFADSRPYRSLARFPEQGYFEHLTRFDVPWLSSKDGGWARPPTQNELTEMVVNPRDLPIDFDAENADVNVFHVWDDSLASIASCDLTTGKIILTGELANPAGAHGRNKYVFLNTRQGLTRPGTWYHDRRRNRIVTRPFNIEAGGVFSQTWIPIIENAIRVCKGADGVKISNLGIFLVNAPVSNAGLRGQDLPGAIDATDVSGLVLQDLRFAACAGNAIRMRAVRDFKVSCCRMDRLGGCGVAAEGSMPGEVVGCELHDVGLLYPSSVGIMAGGRSQLVWILQGRPTEVGSVRIADNLIDGVPYCGIVCSGAGNTIEGNEVVRTMLELNDGAAIYCSRGEQCRIAGNFVADVRAGNGLYLDEGCCRCDVGGNVVLRTKTPVCCHIAIDNCFHDNVMADDGDMKIAVPRSKGLQWRDCILYASGRIRFYCHVSWSVYYPTEEVFRFDNVFAYAKDGGCRIDGDTETFPPVDGLSFVDPLVGIDGEGRIFFRSESPMTKYPRTTFSRKKPLALPTKWSVFAPKN